MKEIVWPAVVAATLAFMSLLVAVISALRYAGEYDVIAVTLGISAVTSAVLAIRERT